MLSLLPLLTCLLWFGPAAAVLLLAVILEQRRNAPNGTRPEGNIVLRCLVGGIVAALIWFVLVMLLAAITQASNASLWIVFTPWAFALGEAVALLTRSAAPYDSSQG
jgi:hypothetical protein